MPCDQILCEFFCGIFIGSFYVILPDVQNWQQMGFYFAQSFGVLKCNVWPWDEGLGLGPDMVDKWEWNGNT